MHHRFSLIAFIVVLLIANPTFAQTATPTTTNTATASPTPGTTTTTPIFSTRSVVLSKFRRFFTRNQVKRGELTASITTALLAQAKSQEASGDTGKAVKTLEQYTRETVLLQTIVANINANTDNPTIQTFLEGVVADQALILATLEDSNPSDTGIATQFVELQSQTLRDITRTLEKDMSDAEREKKLTKIMARYDRKLTEVDEKIAKLALLDGIEEETEDTELEDELENESEDVLDDAVEDLDDDDLKTFAEKLDDGGDDHAFIRLEQLLASVPESAKTGIETAIDAAVASKLATFNDDPTKLEAFAATLPGNAADKEKVLERIKEKASPALKQAIETEKKKVETQREADKKAQEAAREKQKKDAEKAKETAKPESSSTQKSEATATPEVQSSEIEVKVKDGKLEKSSYSVKKNSKLTIKFANEDETSRALTLSNGTSSSSVSKGEAKLSAFTISESLTFTVTGISSSGSITAQ